MSKQALAQKAGLHQTHVGLLERCERIPTIDTADALARALEVDLSDMIEEAEAIRHGEGQR